MHEKARFLAGLFYYFLDTEAPARQSMDRMFHGGRHSIFSRLM